MSKLRIKVVTIGHLPFNVDLTKIQKWRSKVFEVVGDIESFSLRGDSDCPNWEFSDDLIAQQIPNTASTDFIIAIVNVPIQDNWYSRRLDNNKIVFTFHQIRDILTQNNIPLENAILRILYAYSLLFLRSQNRIPSLNEPTDFTHDETRGCLFDMNGIKAELVASCHNPKICDECKERLRQGRVSNDIILLTQKEIRNIKQRLYFRLLQQAKTHPLRAILISSIFAVFLNIGGNFLTPFIAFICTVLLNTLGNFFSKTLGL